MQPSNQLCRIRHSYPVSPVNVSLRPTLETIIDTVIKALDGCVKDKAGNVLRITAGDVLGKCRRHEFVMVRYLMMYIASKAGYSFSEIGRDFNRDHTTVMYAVNESNDCLKTQYHLFLNYYNTAAPIFGFKPIAE